jgi:hypothetical protein
MKKAVLILLFIVSLVGGELARCDFVDVTEETLGAPPDSVDGYQSVAWPDINSDGWPDLFGGTPCFYLNNMDGTFTRVDAVGMEEIIDVRSLHRHTFADADNDGDLDCVTSNYNVSSETYTSKVGYFENLGGQDLNFRGEVVYEIPQKARGGQPTFVDGDGNGTYDIYLGTFGNWDPYGLAADRYFMRFFEAWEDLTALYIPQLEDHSYKRHVRCTVACDYDNDFDIDIFCTGYGVNWGDPSWENYLWQNDGLGYYLDVAEAVGVAIEPHGRYGIGLASGASWGDYDNDGDFDLAVANIHGWAALYRNDGGSFANVTDSAGLFASQMEWHNTLWLDFDNDGDLDLFLTQWYVGNCAYIFRNDGPENPGYFTDVTADLGFDQAEELDCVSCFAGCDYDRDGDMDVAFYCLTGDYRGTYLFRNDLDPSSEENHWLVITLAGDGETCGLTALAAQVRIRFSDGTWSGIKQVESTSADGSMNMQPVHFGLGEYEAIEQIMVRWPCGRIEYWNFDDIGGSVDQSVTLKEGTSSSVREEEGPEATVTYLADNYPNPFGSETTIRYSLVHDCNVELKIYNISGQLVTTLFSGRHLCGKHSCVWDGRDNTGKDVSSGIYFYSIVTDRSFVTRKMLLMK